MIRESDLVNARAAIRRGAAPGEPVPSCSCFNEARKWKKCKGVCEDAVEWVARAIAHERVACEEIIRAADAVCAFDWSENDEDAVRTIHVLRCLVEQALSTGKKR